MSDMLNTIRKGIITKENKAVLQLRTKRCIK